MSRRRTRYDKSDAELLWDSIEYYSNQAKNIIGKENIRRAGTTEPGDQARWDESVIKTIKDIIVRSKRSGHRSGFLERWAEMVRSGDLMTADSQFWIVVDKTTDTQMKIYELDKLIRQKEDEGIDEWGRPRDPDRPDWWDDFES